MDPVSLAFRLADSYANNPASISTEIERAKGWLAPPFARALAIGHAVRLIAGTGSSNTPLHIRPLMIAIGARANRWNTALHNAVAQQDELGVSRLLAAVHGPLQQGDHRVVGALALVIFSVGKDDLRIVILDALSRMAGIAKAA